LRAVGAVVKSGVSYSDHYDKNIGGNIWFFYAVRENLYCWWRCQQEWGICWAQVVGHK